MIAGAFGSKLYAQEDITNDYLTNADLSSLDGWTEKGYTAWKKDGAVNVIEFWNWSEPFSFSQTITLPQGDYRLAVNAFYRESWGGNGTNNDMAWIFANDTKQNVIALNSMDELQAYTGSNDLYRAATAFSQGQYSNEFDFNVENNDTEVTLGFTGTTPNGGWCILGPVKLYKYSLDDYLVAYRAKVAEAEALYASPMNADILSSLQDAVVEESSFSLSSQITAAIATLNEKIAAANISIQNYKAALGVINAASTLTANGQADYAASDIIQEIQSAYDARTLVALTVEQIAAAQEALAAAVKKQTEIGADYTPAAPNTWEGQNGGYQGRTERYNAADKLPYEYEGDVMTQTIEGVPAGAYKVTLEATASYTSGRGFEGKTGNNLAAVFANNSDVNLPVVDRTSISSDSEYGPYEVIGKVGTDGVLKYGIKKIDALGGNWFVVKLLSIEKVEYIPVESITAEDIEVEMTATAEIVASTSPSNATFPTITYTSADEEIATVDANGVVTGVAVGETTITLTADEVNKTISVNVVAPSIVPESITLNQSTISLKFGEETTATITATVSPEEAIQEVTFESSDPNIATVDAEGNVTATGIGQATITVTSKVKEDVTATATVTVSGADAPEIFSEEITDGEDYWLLNAATGKFLGGANSWGTRASLIEHGIPFKFIKSGDAYNLDSYTSNGGESHFLAETKFIDGSAANITASLNENGSFSLKIGNNYLKAKTSNTEVDMTTASASDPFAQWYLLSMDDRVASLEEKKDNDATFFIKDYNFSHNNTQSSAWTFEASNQNISGGDNTNCCAESWHANFSIQQQLIVPNGTYKLTAQGFYADDMGNTPPYFFANDKTQAFPERTGSEDSMDKASASFSAGKYPIVPIEVTVTDHILNIGAKCETNIHWCIWDNFELELVSLGADQDIVANVSSVGYTTMYYDKLNLKVPTGVEVYTAAVAENGTTITMTKVDADAIPAGTGVIIKAKQGEYTFPVSYKEAKAIEGNQLKGTDEETTIEEEGYKYYVLSVKGGKAKTIGFYYQVDGGTSVKNGAHKAYLAVPVSEANAAGFEIETTNGIEDMQLTRTANGDAYTISGVRMKGNDLPKGLYIIDGKKTVIK